MLPVFRLIPLLRVTGFCRDMPRGREGRGQEGIHTGGSRHIRVAFALFLSLWVVTHTRRAIASLSWCRAGCRGLPLFQKKRMPCRSALLCWGLAVPYCKQPLVLQRPAAAEATGWLERCRFRSAAPSTLEAGHMVFADRGPCHG
jgi:hypothetical protein